MATQFSPLVTAVRSKFPGQYDDMDDATLEKSVLQKHPEYKDMASHYTEAGASANPPIAPLPKEMQPNTHGQTDPSGKLLPSNIADAATQQMNVDTAIHRAGKSPTPMTDAASIIGGTAGIPEAIESEGFKGAAKGVGRGLMKSAASSTVGAGVGAGIGTAVGHPREGAEIGGVVGGVAGPFLDDTMFSRAPYGINRAILGEEGLADARASSKLAQRNADTKVGLRNPPAEPEIQPGDFGYVDTESNKRLNTAALKRRATGPVSASGLRSTPSRVRSGLMGTEINPKIPVEVEKTNVLPEPGPTAPGQRPGSMFSVERQKELEDAAQRGVPGAADVLKSLGRPIIYKPRRY